MTCAHPDSALLELSDEYVWCSRCGSLGSYNVTYELAWRPQSIEHEQAYRELKDVAATIIAVKDEAHERMNRVIVAAKAWCEWFIVGQAPSLRKANNPNGALVRAVEAYVEWLHPRKEVP